MKLIYIAISIICFGLFSCDNSFSKYEKKEKNDLEKSRLYGNVKEVSRYCDGEIREIDKYNKYGFLCEKVEYENNQVSETTSYLYDEYGCLKKEIYKGPNCKSEREYLYDDKHNVTTSYSNIIEAYNNKVTVGRHLLSSHEYSYDDLGNVLTEKIRTGESTENGNYKVKQYNLNGILVGEMSIDENGRIKYAYKYEYYSDGKEYRTIWYNSDGTVRKYWESQYFGNNESTYTIYENDCVPYVKRYKCNEKNDLIWDDEGDGSIITHEYKYDDKDNIISHTEKRDGTIQYKETFQITYF